MASGLLHLREIIAWCLCYSFSARWSGFITLSEFSCPELTILSILDDDGSSGIITLVFAQRIRYSTERLLKYTIHFKATVYITKRVMPILSFSKLFFCDARHVICVTIACSGAVKIRLLPGLPSSLDIHQRGGSTWYLMTFGSSPLLKVPQQISLCPSLLLKKEKLQNFQN